MDKIRISQLEQSEWKKYKEIRLEALKTNPTAFLNTYEDALRYSDEKWKTELSQSQKKENVLILFAFRGKKIVGMNVVNWNNRSTIKHIADVWGIFIYPDERGKGIGKSLMEAAISEIKNNPQFTKIKLGVNAENKAALKLYIDCGFQIVGKYKNELKFGHKYYDETLLEKIL